jgi:lipopolysaccharide transport system ATP-binding protein
MFSIRANKLSKAYRIYHTATGDRQLHTYRTLREDLVSFGKTLVTKPQNLFQRRSSETFYALRDASFEVGQGEVIGIIGRNGAGKSTLLKVLSRITEPTSGTAEIRGRIGALLEVGTGFSGELTGRENVFMNGSILGMRRREIEQRFDEIVAFSEIEQFLDTPVKRYSSGMYMRLAFAVAAHLNPEILIVDEVLAVGDLSFQKKCLGKMDQVSKQGRTVLFVSHNMQTIRALCPRCLLMKQGRVVMDDDTNTVIDAYNREVAQSDVTATTAINDSRTRRGSGEVRFTAIHIKDAAGNKPSFFEMGSSICFEMSYEVFASVQGITATLVLKSGRSGEMITSVKHIISEKPLAAGHTGTFTIELPNANLRPGEYPLYFWLGKTTNHPYDVVDGLTAPLMIQTEKSADALAFDPSKPFGVFDIESRLI